MSTYPNMAFQHEPGTAIECLSVSKYTSFKSGVHCLQVVSYYYKSYTCIRTLDLIPDPNNS